MAAINHTDHLELIVPHPGACYFQDHIVQRLASTTKADLLVIDIYDLVHLAQQTFHRHSTSLLSAVSSEGVNVNTISSVKQWMGEKQEEQDTEHLKNFVKAESLKVYRKEEDMLEEEEEEEEYDDDDVEKVTVNFNEKEYSVDINSLDEKKSPNIDVLLNRVSNKYTTMFRNLLSDTKESKMVYLRDCVVMQDAFTLLMLKSLMAAVEDLKQKGYSLMVIASHSQGGSMRNYFTPISANVHSTMLLPPSDQWLLWEKTMKKDEGRRIAEINAKGWVTVCNQKQAIDISIPTHQDALIQDLMSLPDISKKMWSLSEVNQRAAVVIGRAIENKRDRLDLEDFKAVNESMVKTAPLLKQSLGQLKSTVLHSNGSVDMDTLKQTCNKYEQKLLPRIVDPNKVQETFANIRTPPSTVDTLQSLISLPLVRPDLFKHGILKKNFIPGLLLFGPPGTGKTMLAKAVARESGSRMLDIQASDIYEMYVGQGEKNVKAVFSLARKLSPCVVFIDEVDSLMSKRGSDHSSKSHREIINQFMVEWDGLSSDNKGVIVMAATNRPFDLDDAVLRRMPRRILVDLPNEQDRLEIFKLLLKDENHQALLPELAKSTVHYSGSDLKNVCVTAALKAVQDQVKSKSTDSIVLTMEHFKEALKMVPASSSEEMGSLVEIRKWDNQFGDGKKKKKTDIGFS